MRRPGTRGCCRVQDARAPGRTSFEPHSTSRPLDPIGFGSSVMNPQALEFPPRRGEHVDGTVSAYQDSQPAVLIALSSRRKQLLSVSQKRAHESLIVQNTGILS